MVARAIIGALLVVLGAASVTATATPTAPTVPIAIAPAQVDTLIAAAKTAMLTDPAAAIRRAQAARDLAARLPGRDGQVARATAIWLMGEASVRSNDLPGAERLLEQALALAEKVAPGTKLHADILMSRGVLHLQSANVAVALSDLQGAYEEFRKLGEARSQALALVSISALYLNANDFAGSLKYVNQALQVYDGDPLLLITIRNNRGDTLRELGRYDEAESDFRQALAQAQTLNIRSLQVTLLCNLARTQLDADQSAAAGRTIAQAYRALTDEDQGDARAQLDAIAAQALLQAGRLADARDRIDRALAAAGAAGTTVSYWQAHKTAYAIYKALGDDSRALSELETLKKIDDKTNRLAASTNTALMAARFDFTNQRLKISELQRDQERKNAEFERARARTQQQISIGVTAAAALVIGLLVFGIVTIQRKNKEVTAANADLAQTNTALEKALAAKTEFLATTSHEIRTPLNGILGMTQVMLADTRLDAGVRDRIGVVHGAGVSMRALVDDILDVAKMETGNLTVEQAPIDLPALLTDVSRMWQDQARAKGLGFDLDLNEAPARIESDPTRLRQVVFNLLSNALKFTERGSVTLKAAAVGDRLSITVSDTGIGIPAGKLDEIFEAFRQADAGTTRRFGGTGLGLAICRNIARALDGDVTVASREGEGASFTLDLPLTLVEAPAQLDVAPGDRLVIIDRNPITRAMLRTLLARQAEEVVAAAELGDLLPAAPGVRTLIDESAIRAAGDPDAIASRLAGANILVLWAGADADGIARLEAAGVIVAAKPIAGQALAAKLFAMATPADLASRAA